MYLHIFIKKIKKRCTWCPKKMSFSEFFVITASALSSLILMHHYVFVINTPILIKILVLLRHFVSPGAQKCHKSAYFLQQKRINALSLAWNFYSIRFIRQRLTTSQHLTFSLHCFRQFSSRTIQEKGSVHSCAEYELRYSQESL